MKNAEIIIKDKIDECLQDINSRTLTMNISHKYESEILRITITNQANKNSKERTLWMREGEKWEYYYSCLIETVYEMLAELWILYIDKNL